MMGNCSPMDGPSRRGELETKIWRLAELIGKSLREICGGLTASEGKLRHANLKLTLQDVLK